MVITEKHVADQLKAFNIGFKPTKEQIEESLLYIDSVRINQPKAYKKFKESIFDPYETKVRDLEAEYGEFKRGIILQTLDAEKALQQIVDRSIQEGKNPNIDDVTREAAKQSVETIKQGYTERMLPTFDMRINAVKEKLAAGDDRAKKLLELLEAVLKNVTSASVNALQTEMLSGRTGVTVSKKGDPDGYFGPLTMSALEMIAGVKAEEAKQSEEKKTALASSDAKQSGSVVDDLKSKAAAAGTAVSKTVSSAVSSVEKKLSSTKSEAPTTPSANQETKLAPQSGFTLKDGTKVQGMYVKEGRMWFIGAKGERKELNPSLLPDGVNAKEITAINVNAKKLTSLVSDVELVLQATANHAKIANWPNPKSWENKLVELGTMLQTLDISDEIKARRAIIDFVKAAPAAKGNLSKEFAEIFNLADNDAERHARIYKYIRGSWYNPTASGAGFDGGSEMLSNRIATTELLKQNIGPKELEAFVIQWMNGNWSNASDESVSKAIIQSAKNVGGAFKYVANVFGEKNLPDFVKSFKSSVKQLNDAYKDPKIDTELAKVIKTEDEREKYKRESRNAKLMTLLGTTALAKHLKNKPQERDGNFELDTFANINGTGAFEISDTTAKYIRNDLWKDVTIEVMAIGAGVLTAGLGTAAIHALAAGRWAVRAGEATRIGIRAEQVATRVVAGGVFFEWGHGLVRGAVSKYNGGSITDGYSWAGFAQSIAFAGAFEIANKALRLAKMPLFDTSKSIFEQKALLAKYASADALASVGVMYGISRFQGEAWTYEEMFQAIVMAALFRTAMTRAEGVKFRVKKTENQVIVEPEVSTVSKATDATPVDTAETAKSDLTKKEWKTAKDDEGVKGKDDTKNEEVAKNEEGVDKKKVDKETQKAKEVTEVVKDPELGDVEIKTGENASMNKVDKDGKKTPLTPDEEAGVLVRNKDKGELAKIFSGERQIYHLTELFEPLYLSAKKYAWIPISFTDRQFRKIPLVKGLYGKASDVVQWTWRKAEGITTVLLHDISTPADIALNIAYSIWRQDQRGPGNLFRSMLYADRRDAKTYKTQTDSWTDWRRLNVVLLAAMGVTAATVYREEEWTVRGPLSQMWEAILWGGITTYFHSKEAYDWKIHVPGITDRKTTPKEEVSEAKEESILMSPAEMFKRAEDSVKSGGKKAAEMIKEVKDNYENN